MWVPLIGPFEKCSMKEQFEQNFLHDEVILHDLWNTIMNRDLTESCLSLFSAGHDVNINIA